MGLKTKNFKNKILATMLAVSMIISSNSFSITTNALNVVATDHQWTFNYTGGTQSVTLPKGKYKIECYGAQGGGTYGGYGGYQSGEYEVTSTSGQTVYVYCGGQGTSASLSTSGGSGGGKYGGGHGGSGGYGGGGMTYVSTSSSDNMTATVGVNSFTENNVIKYDDDSGSGLSAYVNGSWTNNRGSAEYVSVYAGRYSTGNGTGYTSTDWNLRTSSGMTNSSSKTVYVSQGSWSDKTYDPNCFLAQILVYPGETLYYIANAYVGSLSDPTLFVIIGSGGTSTTTNYSCQTTGSFNSSACLVAAGGGGGAGGNSSSYQGGVGAGYAEAGRPYVNGSQVSSKSKLPAQQSNGGGCGQGGGPSGGRFIGCGESVTYPTNSGGAGGGYYGGYVTNSSNGGGGGGAGYYKSGTITNPSQNSGIQSGNGKVIITCLESKVRVTYNFNWGDASHGSYSTYTDVITNRVYSGLVHPSKYYTVTYNSNGGNTLSKTSDQANFTFEGWYLESGLSNKITEGTTKETKLTDHTVYAKWSTPVINLATVKNSYTGNFKLPGYMENEELVSGDNHITKTSEQISLESEAQFNGWYTAASGGTRVGGSGDSYSVSKNITLYAQFGSTQSVSIPEAASSTTVIIHDYLGNIVEQTDVQGEFKGWYSAATGGTLLIDKNTKQTTFSENKTYYARFSDAEYKLKDQTREGYTILGYFDKPYGETGANFLGGVGDTIKVRTTTNIYPWFISEPTIVDVDDYQTTFYEGQIIKASELLKMVEATDIESSENNTPLVVSINKITYNNGEVDNINGNNNYELKTSTAHVGNFTIEYMIKKKAKQIVNGKAIEADITTYKNKICRIEYNNLPSLTFQPYIYMYNNDPDITETTVESFIANRIKLNDAEDDNKNNKWIADKVWNTDLTERLDKKLEYKIANINVSTAYEKDNSSEVSSIKNITNLKDLFKLKQNNYEKFRAVASFDIIVDTTDLFGKKSSGELTMQAINKGVKAQSKDKKQLDNDRTITVIMSDIMVYNSTLNDVRQISSKYIETIGGNTYWGDENYGKKLLEDVLNKRDNKDSISNVKEYNGVLNKSNNSSIKIHVKDYSNN